MSQVSSFACRCPVFPVPLLDASLLLVWAFVTFVDYHLAVDMSFISRFSTHSTRLHIFCCSFKVSSMFFCHGSEVLFF